MEKMASQNRNQPTDLKDLLFAQTDRFEFHAALKIIERMHPDLPPIGSSSFLNEQPVFMKAHPSFQRAATDLWQLTPDQVLWVNFFGIETLQGPLPEPLMEFVYRQLQSKNKAPHEFLSIFNHRLLSILHRIRKKYWIGIDISPPERTPYGKSIQALTGIGTEALASQLYTPPRSLLYYAGLIWGETKSEESLKCLLRGFLNQPLKINACTGEWIKIPVNQRTSLGTRFSKLGHDASIGEKFYDQQSCFSITLGPMDLEDFIDFLKPGVAYRQLLELIKFYVGTLTNAQVILLLKKEAVPPARLGVGAALGWTTFLKTTGPRKTDGCVKLLGAWRGPLSP